MRPKVAKQPLKKVARKCEDTKFSPPNISNYYRLSSRAGASRWKSMSLPMISCLATDPLPLPHTFFFSLLENGHRNHLNAFRRPLPLQTRSLPAKPFFARRTTGRALFNIAQKTKRMQIKGDSKCQVITRAARSRSSGNQSALRVSRCHSSSLFRFHLRQLQPQTTPTPRPLI